MKLALLGYGPWPNETDPALFAAAWTAHWLYWLALVTAMIAAGRNYEALRDWPPGECPYRS